jgi:hypothetical protein
MSGRQPKWGLAFKENYVTSRASSYPREPEESLILGLILSKQDETRPTQSNAFP